MRLSPSHVSKRVYWELKYLNTLDSSVCAAADTGPKAKGTVIGLLSSKMKSARQQLNFKGRLSTHHRRLAPFQEPTMELPQKRRELERRAAVVRLIHDYLSQDEQSRQNPGRRDCVSVNGELVQTRVCTDYMGTLYQRFRAEHPLEQVGRTTFFTNRPAHILKSSSLQTFGCLCQTHENAGLMLKALRSVVPSTISVSPDTFCGDYPDAESVSTLVEQADTTSEISFSQWQRVKCDDGKQRTKIVVCKLPADDFLQKVTRVVEDFRDHAGRVNTQYVELKKLKDSLPTTSLLLQMDFAENFSCSSGPRNVQSSYWNPQTVTLHPIMVYYRETVGGELLRKSFCYMSSVPSHNTTIVVTILKSLLLTELRPLIDHLDINKVYYITDSPVSQYRNKFIFYVVSCHQQIFGMPAVWHYFEKGHGKGPCDGIGGAVKRGAAQAAKHGVPMADAHQFHDWAMQHESGISFVMISRFEYNHTEADVTLIEKRLQPVSHTLSLHSIRSNTWNI